jgi:hypothetical protein
MSAPARRSSIRGGDVSHLTYGPIMHQLHTDDAIDYLARHLANKFTLAAGSITASIQCAPQYDVEVQYVAAAFWQERGTSILNQTSTESEPYCCPFFDGAWYLCRIGVLRPGEKAPGMGIGLRSPGWKGDGFSLTHFGREWITTAAQRPPSDAGRFGEIMQPFSTRFGAGFLQRALEASRCYQTGNYLACCAMAGAAVESVLLAVAVAKMGDEEKVLKEYRSSGGRKKITDRVTGAVNRGLADHFVAASGVLSFWRDETAHGMHTTISEIEAQASLAQLLRFAQLVHENWRTLTS